RIIYPGRPYYAQEAWSRGRAFPRCFSSPSARGDATEAARRWEITNRSPAAGQENNLVADDIAALGQPRCQRPLRRKRRTIAIAVSRIEAYWLEDFHQTGGVLLLAEIRFQEGETIENALRRFKRKVQQEDIIKEVKKHSFYLKPGERKRVKQALARKRNRKKSRRDFE